MTRLPLAVSTVKQMTGAAFIDLLYSVLLSSDPILSPMYITSPPFPPSPLLFPSPFDALTHTQIREFDRERTNSPLSSLFGLDPDGTYLERTHSPRLLDLHTHTHP